MMLISLCAEAIKPLFLRGTKSDSRGRNCISLSSEYPVSRITGEGRVEFSRAWGHGFEQEGAGGRGGEWAGQLKMCVETINLLKG